MQNKAINYRTMLTYLGDLGADLVGHDTADLAFRQAATLDDMDRGDLMHYQRILEATIDNRNELMDRDAMKDELAEVVRERMARGGTERPKEAREFRARVAHVDSVRYTRRRMAGSFVAMLDHEGHIYQGDSRDTDALCGHDWGETYRTGSNEDRYQTTNGIWVGGYDDPRGTLASVQKVAADNNISVCHDCAEEAENYN